MSFKRGRDIKEANRRISGLMKSIKEVESQNIEIKERIADNNAQIYSLQDNVSELRIENAAYEESIEDNNEWIEEAKTEINQLKNMFEGVEIRACDKPRPDSEKRLTAFT